MDVRPATAHSLLERADELRRIRRVLDGEGGVVAIAAPAGLGKTKVLEAAIADARAEGIQTLDAHSSELERGFAFGVVRQLLEAAVLDAGEQRAELLSGAARHAAAVLDLDPDATLDRDVHATLHGLYWLLVNLAAGEPLLVAVDDLQWADEPSLRWLAYVARRLERVPITLLATVRTGEHGRGVELPAGASELTAAAIDELVGQVRTLRVEPAPLSVDAVAVVLERSLGRAPDEAFAQACRTQTGGNAFLVSELVAELAAEDVAPVAGNAGLSAHVVPERVGDTVRRHLARVGDDARALAASVAVLGDGRDPALTGELAGMDVARVATAANELIAAQILVDAPELRFRHPLLRAAVLAQSPPLELAARHGRAAHLLSRHRAPSARVATHLLAATPTAAPWAVGELRAAARSARAQGVPEQAVALLRRALREPPPDDAQRAAVLRELGSVELDMLDGQAAEHLARARELTGDPRERAEITLSLAMGYYHGGRHDEGVNTLLAAIDEARDDPSLREEWLRLEALLGLVGRYDLQTEARTRGRLVDLAERLEGATPAERLVQSMALSERPGPNADGLYRATLMSERAAAERVWPDPTGIGVVAMYLHAGRPDAARSYTDALVQATREDGSPMRYSIAVVSRACLAQDVGDLRAADADFETAFAIWREFGEGRLTHTTIAVWATVLEQLGRGGEAEQMLTDYDLQGEIPPQMHYNHTLFHRGAIRLRQRRFDAAEADFRELGRRHATWGMTRPTPPWRSGAALALIGADRPDEARPLAAEELELARAWNTPKSISIATRALALSGGGDEAIAGLERAVALLIGTPWRLDRARARCDLGSALRRAGRRRDARAILTLAMDEAHACGAAPLAERAADELRATGARPRRRAVSGRDALTASELRVAALAAGGRTNRQVAEELFVTLATVETHLSRTYRKLDITGRAALAEALSAEPG